MSIAMMSAVGDLNLSPNLKFVLMKYADCADEHGRDTWPSHDRVARFTSLSVKTVQRAVGYFRACGVLVAQAPGEAGIGGSGLGGHGLGGRGKRGKGIAYTLDIERARDLFGYWHESRNGTVMKLIGGKPIDDQADGDGGEVKTPDTVTGVSPVDKSGNPGHGDRGFAGETLDTQAETPVTRSLNPGQRVGGEAQETAENAVEPSSNHPEPSQRARDPSAVGDGDARAEPEGPPPACAVWREAEAALRAVPAWELLSRAIPDADDGETLTLAVEAPWVGYAILAWARGGAFGAEALLHRRIDCRVRRWVRAALAERDQFTAGKPSLAAHRRDGETVRLSDAPWRAWAAARAEHPECGWLDCALPDDIEAGVLVVKVGDARQMTALLDGALDGLAAVVGMPVKPRYGGDMDTALKAQREGDPLRVMETAGGGGKDRGVA